MQYLIKTASAQLAITDEVCNRMETFRSQSILTSKENCCPVWLTFGRTTIELHVKEPELRGDHWVSTSHATVICHPPKYDGPSKFKFTIGDIRGVIARHKEDGTASDKVVMDEYPREETEPSPELCQFAVSVLTQCNTKGVEPHELLAVFAGMGIQHKG